VWNGISLTSIQDKQREPTFESTLEQALVILIPPVDRNVAGVRQNPSCNGIGEERVLDLKYRSFVGDEASELFASHTQ
jgi:hypothetical protein